VLVAACLGLAAGLALGGPAAVRPLLWLPAALLPCLVWYRPTVRFTAWAVDGALLVGALLAVLTSNG